MEWIGSPDGEPHEEEVSFGTFTLPDEETLKQRGLKIEFRLAESFIDNCNLNDQVSVVLEPLGVKEDVLPTVWELSNVTPNPFMDIAVIKYAVPTKANVNISIYDVTGELVKTLVNGPVDVGYYTIRWNGRDAHGKKVAQGVYFVKMTAPSFVATRKVLVVR